MAYQPKSYRKFLATSVAAAVVVTAAAPAALAAPADAKFSDVSSSHWAIKDINYLVEKGAIQGYPDGTFKPGNSITRAEIAVVLAKTLDLDVDPEVTTDKFSDVPATHWANPYIAAIVDQTEGVIDGYENGTFRPSNTVTRQEMAKMVVEAYDLELVEGKDLPFTDVDGLWSTDYINILASNGVAAGMTTTTFVPRGEVQRAQTAAFVHRAEVEEERIEVPDLPVDDTELAVESVSAINAKQLLVTFNGPVGTNATDVSSYSVNTINNATANNVLGAAVQEGGQSVLLTLEDAYRVNTTVAVAVDGVYVKDSIRETFPKFATTINVNDTTAPSIVSATSKTNTSEAQSVTVKFSEPITDNAIFKVNGRTVSAVSPLTTIDYITAGVTAESVATEYVLSGLELPTGRTHTVEVINAEDYAENKANDILTQTFTVTQDTAAATGKVVSVQDNKIKVTFDKAVNQASLSNVAFFTFDGTTNTYTNETVSGPTRADSAGKEWIFTLDNAAGFYGTNDSTEDVLVKVQAGVIDTTGNPVKPFDATVKLTQDVTGPTLENLTFDKNSKGEVTKLYFQFNELLNPSSVPATIADAQVVVKNTTNNQTASFNSLFGAVTTELASDGKTVVATVTNPAVTPVTSGTYSFEVQTGVNALVTDSAVANNPNQRVAKTVNFGSTTNEVVVTGATNTNTAFDDQVITVTFDKPVTAASAKNPSNYVIAGKALPADTVIVVANDGLSATFDLPRDFIAENDSQATIVVQNIRPVDSSATFKRYAHVIAVTDNTRPTITSSILNTGAIKLSFSESVNTTTPGDDIAKVIVNGLELDDSAYTVASEIDVNSGDEVVVITVAAEEALNYNSTGFSYQYINVDGVSGFNPATDIQLRNAAGTTAPASWANDNGIAKLNLSVINSVEVVTVANPSDIVDGVGNGLKPNATIKVK